MKLNIKIPILKKPLVTEQEITNKLTDIAENRINNNQPTEVTQSVQTPKTPLKPKSLHKGLVGNPIIIYGILYKEIPLLSIV